MADTAAALALVSFTHGLSALDLVLLAGPEDQLVAFHSSDHSVAMVVDPIIALELVSQGADPQTLKLPNWVVRNRTTLHLNYPNTPETPAAPTLQEATRD